MKNALFRCGFFLSGERTAIAVVMMLKIQTMIVYRFKRFHESKDNCGGAQD